MHLRYYYADCSTLEAQTEIKENFVKILKKQNSG